MDIKITSATTMEAIEEWERIEDVRIPYEAKHAEEIKRMTHEGYWQLRYRLEDNYQLPGILDMSIEEVMELDLLEVANMPEWTEEIKQFILQYGEKHLSELQNTNRREQLCLSKCLTDNYQLPGIMDMSIEEVLKLPYTAPEWKKEKVQLWKDEETIEREEREKEIRLFVIQYENSHMEGMKDITRKGQLRLDKCLEDNYNLPGIMDMSIEEVLALSEDKEDIQIWKNERKIENEQRIEEEQPVSEEQPRVNTLVQLYVDESLRTRASYICERVGIDLPTYLRMCMKRLIRENGIPFSMKLDSPLKQV